MTVIAKCNCNHEFQDQKYGVGYRVHNPRWKHAGSAMAVDGYRCSVCAKERAVTEVERK